MPQVAKYRALVHLIQIATASYSRATMEPDQMQRNVLSGFNVLCSSIEENLCILSYQHICYAV